MHRVRASLAAGLMSGLAALSLGVVRAADGPSYPDSVDRALALVRSAPSGDTSAASEAADVLEAGTGRSQPEILGDLRATPPRLDDARVRLTALEQAVRNPAFTPEPRKADAAVHGILNEPRYAALAGGPSLWDRLEHALLQLAVWLLDHLAAARGGPAWVPWVALALPVALLLTVTLLLLRAMRGHRRQEARAAGEALASGRTARERFAAAERLAAAGDLTGAVRALAGGVAAALGDERDWEVSPLTVREIFGRSSDPDALEPLLAAFEAVVYGGRDLDAETFASAERAVAPYRLPVEERAA